MVLNRDNESARVARVFGKNVAETLHFAMLDSLDSLIQNRPKAFVNAVLTCDKEALKSGLRDAGVPFGRGIAVPYKNLITALEVIGLISTTSNVLGAPRILNKSDHHRILRAISRSPESQLVFPALFVMLYDEWCDQDRACAANTSAVDAAEPVKSSVLTPLLAAREIHSQLLLTLPDCMFVFDLIRTRLGTQLQRLAQVSDLISPAALASMLRDAAIVVTHERWAALLNALKRPEYGVLVAAPGSVEFLSTSGLLRVCNACTQSNVLAQPDYKAEQGVREYKQYGLSLLRRLRTVWPAVLQRLAGRSKAGCAPEPRQHGLHGSTNADIASSSFFDAVAAAGLLLSASDSELAWAFLQLRPECPAPSGTVTPNAKVEHSHAARTLPLATLDAIFRSDLVLALDVDANAASHVSLLTALTHRADSLTGPRAVGHINAPHQVRRHVSSNVHQASTVLGQYLQWRPDEYAMVDIVQTAATDARKLYVDRMYGHGTASFPWEVSLSEEGNDMGNAIQPHSVTGSSSALPWMQHSHDENCAVNNSLQRIAQRLDALSAEGFSTFMHNLRSPSVDTRQKSAERNPYLTRNDLTKALASVGVRLDPKQASLLFAGAASAVCEGQTGVTADSWLLWLEKKSRVPLAEKLKAALLTSAVSEVCTSVEGQALQSEVQVGDNSHLQPKNQHPRDNAPVSSVCAEAESAGTVQSSYLSAFEPVNTSLNLRGGQELRESQAPVRSQVQVKGTKHAEARTFSLQAAVQNRERNASSHIFGFADNISGVSLDAESEVSDLAVPYSSALLSGVADTERSRVAIANNACNPPAAADVSAAVTDVLLQKRAALALLFRRLTAATHIQHSTDGSNAGLVPLVAFESSLASLIGGSLGQRLAAEPVLAHKVACDIVNAPYNCDAATRMLHFTDVISFLNAVGGEKERGDQASSILRRLKDKCHVAAPLKGERLRMLMLTPQLRQRLKQRFLAGKSAGGIGVGSHDHCNAQDLVECFEGIEVYLSPIEARFLCDATGDNSASRTTLEAGTTLGAVIRYLSENLLV